MSDEDYEAFTRERLSRFGDRAGKHGPLYASPVACLIRLRWDTNRRVGAIAAQLGTRKATLIAQLVEAASMCHPADWYRAVAAFQAAQKRRATSELAEAGLHPEV